MRWRRLPAARLGPSCGIRLGRCRFSPTDGRWSSNASEGAWRRPFRRFERQEWDHPGGLQVGEDGNVIGGAGIDVFEEEPPTDSALLELDNVVVTPHTAAFTFEGMNNMSVGVVEQLIEYQKGNKPKFIVNSEVYDRQK